MKVTCEIDIGNDAEMSEKGLPEKLSIQGFPNDGSGFITLQFGEHSVDVRPGDLRAAIDRTESAIMRRSFGGLAA